MAQNVSNIMYFQKNQVCKIPPRGGGGTNVFLARGLKIIPKKSRDINYRRLCYGQYVREIRSKG